MMKLPLVPALAPAVAVLGAALLAACATPVGDTATAAQNAIDSAARIAPPASDSPGSASQSVLTQTIPYNLGRKIRSEQQQRSATLPNGLRETIMQAVSSTGSGTVAMGTRTVSLCGLVPLIEESGAGGSAGMLVFTGKAGAFVPVGGSVPMSRRQIATAFEASQPGLCDPRPGMSFSFKTPIMLETNIPPFRRVEEFTETWTCQASDGLASYPEMKQAGASLLLSCNITAGRADRPKAVELVYLPQLREYFPMLLRYSEDAYTTYSYTRPPERAGGR